MGHICDKKLNLVKQSSIGINFSKNTNEKCVVCLKGKQTRKSFKEKGKRAENLLDLIHSDLMGPLNVSSYSGARFLLTFVDDFSRKVFIVPIKRKSDVYDEIVKFKKFVENQCSRKIKAFRSDNGTEYMNKRCDKFFENCGILHQKMAPYTPEHNGVAERMNRTIIERVRCMLIDSGVNVKFWAEASITAVYLINRMPCRSNDRSPEEIWTNEKPNLEHLRVFGCKAMTHVPKQKRTKLDSKSTECFLLGYTDNSKTYRLYNPETKKIVISRDVVFIEAEKKVIENDSLSTNFSLSPVVELFTEDITDEIDNSEGEDEDESSTDETSSESSNETVVPQNHESTLIDLIDVNDSNLDELTRPDANVDNTPQVNQPIDSDANATLQANESTYSDVGGDDTFQAELGTTSAGTRQSSRTAGREKPSYTYPKYSFCVRELTDPCTVEEVLNRPDAYLWKAAMQEEIESLNSNKTWAITDLPAGRKPISSKWVFKLKKNTDGEIVRYKARLVVKGFSQKKGIDYEETFAPVVRYTSIRYLIALSVQFDLTIHQMDVVTAFLNGDLKEDIYMTQPSCYEDGTGRVCKLQKALYGLKQSSRVWNQKLNRVLIETGLKRSDVDQCIYVRRSDSKVTYVAIWVDDALIFSNDLEFVNHLKSELSKRFQMKDMGIASSALGIRITRNENDGTIKIDQSQYIADILKRYRMDESNPISAPLDINQKLSSEMCPTTEAERIEMAKVPYMSAIGSLLFAAQITRPDISFAVNLLSRFGANPGKAHWTAVKRVMRYLKGTIEKGITYRKQESELTGFCDADWGSDLDSRRSTTGYIFMLQGGAISWSTKRQQTVALSTAESELMSMVAAIQESMWLKRMEKELIPNAPKTITLNCDNKSAIDFGINNAYSPRTKHIDIKDKFVRQSLAKRLIKLNYIPTNEMLADILTKGLNAIKQSKFTNELGLE